MKKVYLFGTHTQNSPMPYMMNTCFSLIGLEMQYIALNIDSAKEIFSIMNDEDTVGCNITMPFKEEVARKVRQRDYVVSVTLSANTLVKRSELSCYNTDVYGIETSLRNAGINNVSSAAVIGSGGTARSFIYVCAKLGCKEVSVITRDKEKARRKLSDLERKLGVKLSFSGFEELRDCVELLFNASPIGNPYTETPEALERFVQSSRIYFDAVYFPVYTKMAMSASKKGVKVILGKEMLLYQALKSFAYFTGRDAEEEIMRRAMEERLM